jgi:tetratricopeptide (TPR) repeat protein
MTMLLNSAVVRIHTTSGRVVGAGFLVGERQVLTCAHVVAQAFGITANTSNPPQGKVYLDFPLVAPERRVTALVTAWQPALADGSGDVAGLELETIPPEGVQAVQLIVARDVWGHRFRAFGFPDRFDNGVWASGQMLGPEAAGWIQIEDVKQTGYFVAPGFSGGPVWDEQLAGVVGMTVAADTRQGFRAAFIIPADRLVATWPKLAHYSLNINSVEYLQAHLAILEDRQQNASNPHRFQPKIDDLRETIRGWKERVEKQQQRIADGLTAQRQQIIETVESYDNQKRIHIIGRRPQGVVTHFKDRSQEQQTLRQLLTEPTTRLVSVIGHGGMGKTALVCKVLRDLEQYRWPHTNDDLPIDGIVYFSTRTSGINLERLFLDCAKMLGGEREKCLNDIWTNPQIDTEGKILRLLEALGDGRYVILLDNLDDLLDNDGKIIDQELDMFVEHDLTTVSGARLLVTTRIAMVFKREVMRYDQQVKLLEGLPVEDGIALLRELDPNAEYGLRDAPQEQLAKAVSLVRGVPRALEVIAGILANDVFASLPEILEHFFGQEDVVSALIEENYKRLDSGARRVIEALAVFRRPVPSLAVDYLLEPFSPGLDAPGILRRLIRTNIVSLDRTTKTVALHPIDQDYAYSQLSEKETNKSSYTRQALERRAADYYGRLYAPPETLQTINDLEPQLAEFEHCIRAEDYARAGQVLNLIDSDYLYKWGHYTRLVEMRERLMGRLINPRLHMSNQGRLGIAYYTLGDKVEQALKLLEESLSIARELGDRQSESTWLGNLGHAYRDLGQAERAVKIYSEALIIARELGNQKDEVAWLGSLGLTYRNLGQTERYVEFLEQALTIAREIGDRRGEGANLSRLGSAYCNLGQIEKGVNFHREALAIARSTGDRQREGISLVALGDAHYELGEVQPAIKSYKDALVIFREIGDRWEEGRDLGSLGNAYYALGQVKRAVKFYEEALKIAQEIGHSRGQSFQLLGLGQTLLTTQKLAEARRYCEKALALEMVEISYQTALVLGTILLHQGNPAARNTFADAVARCQVMLEKAPSLYKPRYVLAAALVGQAVCDSRWLEENERANLLGSAMNEYRLALENCAAPGVVHNALRDLEMIRAAGVVGLEPAFALLEST